MKRNIKIKLDKLLAEGHIDTDEYKHIVGTLHYLGSIKKYP